MRSASGEKRSPDTGKDSAERRDNRAGNGRAGKLFIVGLGPGSRLDMSPRAASAIAASDLVIGYQTYLDLIADLTQGRETRAYPMKAELERVNRALDEAVAGRTVALVSSGDPGIYGMAGPALEEMRRRKLSLDVEVVPGISALNACAAAIGAPLMCDFAVISLSDLLVPWETIQKRVEAAAEGDFVVVFFNPQSQRRSTPLQRARDILLGHRPRSTPVGIVRSARRQQEETTVTDLGAMLQHPIDMLTTVIVGNSSTFADGSRMVTRRGYDTTASTGASLPDDNHNTITIRRK